MTSLYLAWAFIARRWGQALLAAFVGALGVAAVLVTLTAANQVPPAAQRLWGGVDLVIGPKGSALDLVLCCALHVSDPRGLVSQEAAMSAARHPMIRAAAPIALGDNVSGWRIMGTTPDILKVYNGQLQQGRVWDKPLEAVLGAEVARELHLGLGDSFVGAHGLAAGGEMHDQFPYKVVGILTATGSALDRLALCDIATVRYIHEQHEADEAREQGKPVEAPKLPDAATAVVASYRSPVAATLVPRLVDASPTLSSGSPSFEVARLIGAARPLISAVLALGVVFTLIAAGSAAAALAASLNSRTKDLALLRVLGARPSQIALVALCEALIITIAAIVLGYFLAVSSLELVVLWLAERSGVVISPLPDAQSVLLVLGGAAIAVILAAGLPAFRAARTSIEEVLAS